MGLWTFTIQEDADVRNEVSRLLPHTLTNTNEYNRSKAKLAKLAPNWETVTVGGSDCSKLGRKRWSPFRSIRERRERRQKEAIPAALRSLVYTCKAEEVPEELPELWQVPPKRWTAKSGFIYPDFLEDFGVSAEDWKRFTDAFVLCASPGLRKMLSLVPISLFFHSVNLPLPQPFDSLLGMLDPAPLMYLSMKRRQTKKRVGDGTIPAWTAYWNMTYFGPKGLTVGFDLPGCIFSQARVQPRRHRTIWMRRWRGPFRQPMSKARIAKFPRITVAMVDEARPEAGSIPQLEARVPRFHQFTRRANVIAMSWNALRKRWAEIEATHARTKAKKANIDRLKAEKRAQAMLAQESATDISAVPSIAAVAELAEEPATSPSLEHESVLSSERSNLTTVVEEAEEPSDYSPRFHRVLAYGRWMDETEGRSQSV